MQYNSQCATRRRCPSCMRPALLRACTLSFFTRAASRFAACRAISRERYLEWRRPQTFTRHQPECSTTSILIFFIAELARRRRGLADAFTSLRLLQCTRGERVQGGFFDMHRGEATCSAAPLTKHQGARSHGAAARVTELLRHPRCGFVRGSRATAERGRSTVAHSMRLASGCLA